MMFFVRLSPRPRKHHILGIFNTCIPKGSKKYLLQKCEPFRLRERRNKDIQSSSVHSQNSESVTTYYDLICKQDCFILCLFMH